MGEARHLILMGSGFKTRDLWDNFSLKGQEEEACGPCFFDVSECRVVGTRGQTASCTVDFILRDCLFFWGTAGGSLAARDVGVKAGFGASGLT